MPSRAKIEHMETTLHGAWIMPNEHLAWDLLAVIIIRSFQGKLQAQNPTCWVDYPKSGTHLWFRERSVSVMFVLCLASCVISHKGRMINYGKGRKILHVVRNYWSDVASHFFYWYFSPLRVYGSKHRSRYACPINGNNHYYSLSRDSQYVNQSFYTEIHILILPRRN